MADEPRTYPDPRGYDDYRIYLSDAMSARWGQAADGGTDDLARTAGCAASHIVNILAGRRDPQGEVLDGLIDALGLRGDSLTAFVLLIRRAAPMDMATASATLALLLELRAGWFREREAARVDLPPAPRHPAVSACHQGPQAPDAVVPIQAGIREAMEALDAQGTVRSYCYQTWTVPSSALPAILARMATLATRVEDQLHRGAPDARPTDLRYLWQAHVFPLTPVMPPGEAERAAQTAPRVLPPSQDLQDDVGDADAADDAEAMEAAPPPPSVWDYIDHHLYLQAYVSWRKQVTPGWSIGRMSLKVEIVQNYLYQIVSGARAPTDDALDRLTTRLFTDLDEQQHFRRLCRLFRERSLRATAELWWEVVETLAQRGHRPPDAVSTALVGLPEFHCLLLAPDLTGFQEDPAWLARLTGLSERRLALAIRFLDLVGLWRRDEHGQVISPLNLWVQDESSVSQAHRQIRQKLAIALRRACQSYHVQGYWRVEGPLRRTAAEALADTMNSLQEEICLLCKAIEDDARQSGRPPMDQIVQINLLFHPQMSRPPQRRTRITKRKG